MNTAENRAHWDKQAALGVTAGTQDLILKQLEQRAILGAFVGNGTYGHFKVLEVGCGLGETSRMIARIRQDCSITAIDSSEAMIAGARKAQAKQGGRKLVRYEVGDVSARDPIGPFDMVYSQRCLINLSSWYDQHNAINAIARRLKRGGRFIMCEHSQDGLNAINVAREALGLERIHAPWHNRYFQGADFAGVNSLSLLHCIPFSAAYYYHSRVINAALAAKQRRQPKYDSPVNKLALEIPPMCVNQNLAQGRLWVWEKA